MDVEAREKVDAQDFISPDQNLVLWLCSPLFPQAIPCFQFKVMFFRHIEALQGLGYQEQTPRPCPQLSKQKK